MGTRLKDIARACALDVSTVSRALRGDPRINQATRQRIQEIATQLNYQPNLMARSLVAGQSLMVWMLVGSLTNPYEVGPATAAAEVLDQNGYQLLIAPFNGNEACYENLLYKLTQGLADGALIIPGPIHSSLQLQRLIQIRYPLVFLDRHVENTPIPYVTTANRKASSTLAKQCIDHGALSGVLIFPETNAVLKERFAGARETFQTQNLPWVGGTTFSPSIIASLPYPMAIISTDQRSILHFLQQYKEALRDKSMVFAVFDGWEGEPYPASQVFVCLQDFKKIGEIGAQLLISQIRREKEEKIPSSILVEPLSYQQISSHF